MSKKSFTLKQAKAIGEQLGVRWDRFDLKQFRAGLAVELEHGTANPACNVTDDDPLLTGKIALAHLTEFPDYYTRLAKMEAEARSFWNSKDRAKKTRIWKPMTDMPCPVSAPLASRFRQGDFRS